METKIKSYTDSTQDIAHSKFEVTDRSCRLEINEKVTPEMIIGRHYRTGREMRACCHGQVATIYFNPMHNSLMIMIIKTTAKLFNGSGV